MNKVSTDSFETFVKELSFHDLVDLSFIADKELGNRKIDYFKEQCEAIKQAIDNICFYLPEFDFYITDSDENSVRIDIINNIRADLDNTLFNVNFDDDYPND